MKKYNPLQEVRLNQVRPKGWMLDFLQKEAKESLEFHIEGLMEKGEDVPEWLKNGDYEFEYNTIR